MNHTMFYLMSWVREKLEKKQINNETRSTGEGEEQGERGRGGEREREIKKSWFEAPQQTGQKDLLKSAASVQSIV